MTMCSPAQESSIWLVLLAGLAWLGNALYALGAPGGPVKHLSPAIVAVAMLAFVYRHGVRRYGGAMMLRFVVTVFAVGWLFETLSIFTGIPFGRYHYTDLMAPFLGHVPIFVLPAYLVMGYASWSLATLILDGRTAGLSVEGARRVPLLAAFLMVLWDLSMDPLRATIEGRWIWIDGGSYFGVPLSNYLGWFLITWIMFQGFAWQLARIRPLRAPDLAEDRGYWLSVPLAYAAFAGEYLLNPFTGNGRMQEALGETGASPQDIFASVAAITLCTLIPAMVLGLVAALRGADRIGPPFSARLGLTSARRPER